MKVTAIIPEELLKEVRQHSQGKNLTECLLIALKEWVALKKIKKLNEKINKSPLEFIDHDNLKKVRSINRKRS